MKAMLEMPDSSDEEMMVKATAKSKAQAKPQPVKPELDEEDQEWEVDYTPDEPMESLNQKPAGEPSLEVNPKVKGKQLNQKPAGEPSLEVNPKVEGKQTPEGEVRGIIVKMKHDDPRIPEKYRTVERAPTEVDNNGITVQKASAVQCNTCSRWSPSFKYMWSEKEVTHYQEFKSDKEDEWTWKRTCVCCMVNQGMEVQDAVHQITGKRVKHFTERSQKYKEAKADVREQFGGVAAMLGGAEHVSNKRIKMLARTNFLTIFKPWSALIALKCASMEAAADLLDTFHQISESLREAFLKGDDVKRINDLSAQIENMEGKIEETTKALAWRSRGAEQDRFLSAGEFSDEWSSYGGWTMRSFYMCGCGCVTPSKLWDRKFSDPLAARQRYYCVACSRRYRVAFGQLVQVQAPDGALYYMKAGLPPKEVEDLRALSLEQEHGDVRSAEELYGRLRTYAPATGNYVLRACQKAELSWEHQARPECDELVKAVGFLTAGGRQQLDAAGMFDWMQLFNFGS